MKSYKTPGTEYFTTKEDFDRAVGNDFLSHAKRTIKTGQEFLVGLSHGVSPSGVYQYILDNFSKLDNSDKLYFTFVNSPLRRQRRLDEVMDARTFLKELLRRKKIGKRQVIGKDFDREDLKKYTTGFNNAINRKLKSLEKEGFDYVILASDPTGRVAGISRKSPAFESKEIAVLVNDRGEEEFTLTPHFLMQSKRIAFLATKSDKRRSLAWLFEKDPKMDESPGFLRFIKNVSKRMTVFIDDNALTWPQIEVIRNNKLGKSIVRVDLANPYNENAKIKRPVVLLIHGFLGLNSYDGLLTTIASHKYIAAAMHYGSVPQDLPVDLYSRNIVSNIEAVVKYFGSRGHPVFLFDHSISNIYFLMINRDFEEYPAIKKYLKGRIGSNPFFGRESKHALIGFLDNVVLPSVKAARDFTALTLFGTVRRIIPFDTKNGVRRRGIRLTRWLMKRETDFQERIWKDIKGRIMFLMSNLDNLPQLNNIPIERALNRLPAKLFAIQVYSALQESKTLDWERGLSNFSKHNIPVLILKSKKDPVAKFVDKNYEGEIVEIKDVTNEEEKNLFLEHLYHMVNPYWTAEIIDNFISKTMDPESTN
jgi:6-phosphogluconolactonase/glucosamine-6-phosphate isomerase/deaminase